MTRTSNRAITNMRRGTHPGLRTLVLTSAAVVAVVLGARAATPGQASQDARPGSVASVDFAVVTRGGQPVADLKLEELTLRIGGKVRPIRSLRFVKVADAMVGAVSAAPEAPAAKIAPAFVTNLATTSNTPRSIVIVVDDESIPIGQEQKLRTALTNFVRDLPPEDNVALVTVPHGGIKVGLTTDREGLRRAIANISPIAPMEAPTCRTRSTLSTLEATLDLLSRTSEQPVTVAFLSSSMAGQSQMEAAQGVSAIGGRGGVSAQAGGCYLQTDDFVRVGAAVAASRARLYVIHPDYSPEPAREGIEHLRGQTNAPLFHLTSSAEPGLYRMARETAGYYLATFDTEPEERSGRAVSSNIRTTRKDVEVRDRPYVVIGRTAEPRPSAIAATTVTTSWDMVRSGKQYRDLPLRATTSASRNRSGAIDVISLFEPMDPSVKIMTATAALINEKGQGITFWQGEADKMTSWPTVVGLTVPPGTYRLRLGAIDSNGRLGLIDEQIVADLTPAGPLKMSGLVFGLSRATGFTPRLQFTTESSAVAYLELYGGTEGMKLSVVFEVATSTDGKAFLSSNGSVAATDEEGKFTVTAAIPLAAFPAGDYVVRAVVTVAGQGSGRVIRTLHKAG